MIASSAAVRRSPWLALQILSGSQALGGATSGGVAWWAHVGGFAAGLALARPFRR